MSDSVWAWPTSTRVASATIAGVDVEIIVVAALGVVVRLRQFLSGRSLWVDEAMVANDLADLGVVESLTERSPRSQMAPPG